LRGSSCRRSAFIQGRLTRAGKPAQASIVFFTGKSVSSSETGEYFTLLSGDPGRNLIRINACDDSFSYTHVPDTPPPLNGSYDIRIPENDFTVTVVDKATSAPLPAATLSFGPKILDRPGAMQYMENWTAGAKGQAVLGPFALPLQGSICGHAQGYLDRCQDIELRKEHEADVGDEPRGEPFRPYRRRGYALVAWAGGAEISRHPEPPCKSWLSRDGTAARDPLRTCTVGVALTGVRKEVSRRAGANREPVNARRLGMTKSPLAWTFSERAAYIYTAAEFTRPSPAIPPTNPPMPIFHAQYRCINFDSH
jgi:hypothetical protein